MLDGFISKFVLCQACENPETDLIVEKDGNVLKACKACGHRGSVDMAHRLVTFIEKNPPPTRRRAKNVAQAAAPVVESAIVDGIKEGGQGFNAEVDADVAQLKSQQRKAERERKRLEVYYAKLDAFADFLNTDLNQPNDSIIEYVKENTLEYKDAVIVSIQTLFSGPESFAVTLREPPAFTEGNRCWQ